MVSLAGHERTMTDLETCGLRFDVLKFDPTTMRVGVLFTSLCHYFNEDLEAILSMRT
jgi:hypothetical protein